MRKSYFIHVFIFIALFIVPMTISPSVHAAPITCPDGTTKEKESGMTIADACGAQLETCKPKASFLGLPTWYAYLPGIAETTANGIKQCTPQLKCSIPNPDNKATTANCDSQSGIDVSKLWLIALAILELLLRLAGLIAVFMVIYGGIKYITSEGQPDATKGARQTIINALIGMVIAVIAAVSVNFGAKLLQ